MVKNPGQGSCNKLFSLGTIKYVDTYLCGDVSGDNRQQELFLVLFLAFQFYAGLHRRPDLLKGTFL